MENTFIRYPISEEKEWKPTVDKIKDMGKKYGLIKTKKVKFFNLKYEITFYFKNKKDCSDFHLAIGPIYFRKANELGDNPQKIKPGDVTLQW